MIITKMHTHSRKCGRTHDIANVNIEVDTSPIATRTRNKIARKNWESSIADADIDDFLEFLRSSTDPWERSLIPEIERAAIQRFAAYNKRAKV
jgi:hypothetical protein